MKMPSARAQFSLQNLVRGPGNFGALSRSCRFAGETPAGPVRPFPAFSLFVVSAPACMCVNLKMRGIGEFKLAREGLSIPSTQSRRVGESLHSGPGKSKRRRTCTLNLKWIRRFFFRYRRHSAYSYIVEASITTWAPAFAGATMWDMAPRRPSKNQSRISIPRRAAGPAVMEVHLIRFYPTIKTGATITRRARF